MFFDLHINGFKVHTLGVHFCRLALFVNFIYIVACGCGVFILTDSILDTYPYLFIHSTTHGHLGCFQVRDSKTDANYMGLKQRQHLQLKLT